MKMNLKQQGFTLIELLVVIVILGILSTIGFANFKGYYGKAFDAERKAAIKAMSTMLKVEAASVISDQKYMYDETDLGEIFDNNDYKLPVARDGSCYVFARMQDTTVSAGSGNQFVFATELEDGTIEANGTKTFSSGITSVNCSNGDITWDTAPGNAPDFSALCPPANDATGETVFKDAATCS